MFPRVAPLIAASIVIHTGLVRAGATEHCSCSRATGRIGMRLQGTSDKGPVIALAIAVLIIIAAIAIYLYFIAPAA
jgi:hypothetical protein